MAQKSYSVVDIASLTHLGVRFGEPLMLWAKGEWDAGQVQQEMTYRFGGIGSNGQFAPAGAIYTYGPPIVMQLAKKGLRRLMGRSIRVGPLRFP